MGRFLERPKSERSDFGRSLYVSLFGLICHKRVLKRNLTYVLFFKLLILRLLFIKLQLLIIFRKEIQGGILYELNGGFTKVALEKLIDYAYTARYVFEVIK